MKTDNPLRDKSYAFSLKIAKNCFEIQKNYGEYVLSKQLLRSATSIGANIEEAIGGHSEKDFYYRLTIAYREARESHYWIRLIGDLELINSKVKANLLQDIDELLKILGSIKKTLQNKLKSETQS